jgi:hypothetical protein
VGVLPIRTSFVVCLFVYSPGGLGEDRLRRDSRLRSSRCAGLLCNLVSSFKCSSFWLLEVGEKLRSRLHFGVSRMNYEDLKRMGIVAGRATTAHGCCKGNC